MDKIKYNYRYLARFIIEAVTPLALSSGEKDILSDSIVMCDINGLPYIPGTSLAGVLRHYIGSEKAKRYFGYQGSASAEDRYGSDLIISEARMIGANGQVVDGLQNIDFSEPFYAYFLNLPIRQHVCINNKGTAVNGGKFDNQVVFKGTRFCFELELLSSGSQRKDDFDDIINALYSGFIRLGGNTRKGFGQFVVRSLKTAELDLTSQLDLYCDKTSSLNDGDWKAWNENYKVDDVTSDKYDKYELRITPEDFYLFGSGWGDEYVDMAPVKSTYLEWDDSGLPHFCEAECLLIPASSVKGAIAHRVAFYYNMYSSQYVDDEMPEEDLQAVTGSNNIAVRELFGYVGKSEEDQRSGNIFISDIIAANHVDSKILNHVSVDYFTGGAIRGALFSEKVSYDTNTYTLTLLLGKADYSEGVTSALERALKDLCNGMLPLGGGVNRGHGYFRGIILKNGCVL